MKAILFLGTSLLGSQYISAAVSALGCRPIFLLNIDEYSGDPRRALDCCEYYTANVNSLDDIIRAINKHDLLKDVVGVTSLLDETIQNACEVAKKFGIAGPDPVLAQLTDKTIVKKIIPEFSPPSYIFTLLSISEKSINKFFDVYNNFNEYVLKPGISSGAVGTYILNEKTSVARIVDIICHSGIESAKQQSWIIQPRISGRLHSLEGFVKNGQISFLGFTRRIRNNLTEIVSEFPVDQDLSQKLQKRCRAAVTMLVQRSNYMNGYFHCEFIINSESSYFIDGNMGRIAGAAIVQQLSLIYGKSPIDIYKHVFDLGIFRCRHTEDFQYDRINSQLTLSINYCLPKAARVLSVTIPPNLTSLHTCIVDNGKDMPKVGVSDSAWVGFLVGYKDRVMDEIQQLTIQTNTGSISPFYLFNEKESTEACELNTNEWGK